MRGAAFEAADDVSSNLLRIGEVGGMRQSIRHGRPHRSWLDGEHLHTGRIQTAAQSLKEQSQAAFGRAVDVV